MVFYSNSLEVLFEHLKANLFSEADDLFFERLVIIPSAAMQQWIELRLLSTLPVACGMTFTFLNQGLLFLQERLFSSPQDYFLPTTVELIIRIKNEIDWATTSSDPIWQPLMAYINNKESRKIALAHHLAQLFERYGIYAGRAAQRWEEHPSNWQEALWARIVSNWDYPGRMLLNMQDKKYLRPLSVHLFTFSHISSLHFNFFYQAASQVPINFYQLSPCQEFWSDLSIEGRSFQGLTLLAPLGKMGRKMAKEIEQSGVEKEESYLVFGGESQLKRIQRDLLMLEETKEVIEDDSIEIHICTNPHQEIFHLHEQLLMHLEKGSIEPKDILVMAPNISMYAPYIQAIFSDINYQITDLPAQKHSPAIAVLFLMLDLEKKRWSAPAILELMAHPLFCTKQGLSEDDLEQIRGWVHTTGISWGMNGEHRRALLTKRHCQLKSDVSDSLDIGTWMHGLGYLMEELALPSYDSTKPSRIHFSQAELLGDFISLLQTLYIHLQQLEGLKTLVEWEAYLKELVTFYLVSSEQSDHLSSLLEKIERAGRLFPEVSYPFSFIYSLLQEMTGNESITINKHALQAVRFCSMLPMRAIPAKIICLIGMNHDLFPRQERLQRFDLLHNEPENGKDYAPKAADFDRYLFLEAIISAREKLWISYQGYNPYDLMELPPSSVVLELFSYITKKRTIAQPFQPVCQKKTSFFIKINHPYTLPKGHFVVDIADLSRLCRSSLQHYLYFHDLKIEEDPSVASEELFTITALQKNLIRRHSLKTSPERVLRKIKTEGRFPLGMFGNLADLQLQDEIEKLPQKKEIKSLTIKPCLFALNSSLSVTFMGTFPTIFQEGLYSPDQCTIKGAAKAWPHLLVLNAYDRSKKNLLFASSDERILQEPNSYLKAFMEYYFYTRDNPFPMIIDWIEPLLKKDEKGLAQTFIYDPALKWQLLGKGEIDYKDLITSCYPMIAKIYQEMVNEWF